MNFHKIRRFLLQFSCLLLSLMLLNSCQSKEEKVIAYVNRHAEELLAACETWLASGGEDFDQEPFRSFVQEISCFPKQSQVVFECYADGILTSSVVGGFYYSKENKISIVVGWAPILAEPVVQGECWEWQEGDDYYIVDKICDHFYWYEAGN